MEFNVYMLTCMHAHVSEVCLEDFVSFLGNKFLKEDLLGT